MAKLAKVISGAQTGADITGLNCAAALGIPTGGTMPKGCKTDIGPRPEWKTMFGLQESDSTNYAVRTRQNVIDADVTLWFGKVGSPGYWCTKNACTGQGKPFYINPSDIQLEYVVNTYEIINVAGNRERLNPEVVYFVKAAFRTIAKVLGKEAGF